MCIIFKNHHQPHMFLFSIASTCQRLVQAVKGLRHTSLKMNINELQIFLFLTLKFENHTSCNSSTELKCQNWQSFVEDHLIPPFRVASIYSVSRQGKYDEKIIWNQITECLKCHIEEFIILQSLSSIQYYTFEQDSDMIVFQKFKAIQKQFRRIENLQQKRLLVGQHNRQVLMRCLRERLRAERQQKASGDQTNNANKSSTPKEEKTFLPKGQPLLSCSSSKQYKNIVSTSFTFSRENRKFRFYVKSLHL